jgi:pimeloyl-ACP methyl ester carboxylesterase
LAGCLTDVVISGVIGMTMAVILGGPSGLSNAFSWVMAEAIWAVIAGFAGWLVYRLVRGTVVPLVKVTSDVACWIGDARYRNELRVALAEHLALLKLGAQDHLVLFAHSLGSVIAVDYLLRGTSPITAGRVTLVTLGSPLLRLIYRFYANLIGHPREAASELACHVPEFAWVNIFRNYDFIGSQLQLGPPDQGSLDACTNQRYLYGLGGHVGYWSDPVVWATLGAALTGLNRRTATALSERADMHCPAEPESEAGVPFCLTTRATLAKMTYAILLVTVPSVSGFRTYWRFQSADNGRQWAEANATADCTFDCKTEFNPNAIRGTTTSTSSCTAKCALTSGTEKTTAWVFKHGDVAGMWQSRLRRLAAKKQSLSPDMAFLADTSAMHACGELRVVYEGSFESSSPTPISVVADPDLSRDRESCDFPLARTADLILETDPRSTESRESSQAFNLFAAIGIAIISLAVTAWAGRIWAFTVLGSPIFVYKKPVYDPLPL